MWNKERRIQLTHLETLLCEISSLDQIRLGDADKIANLKRIAQSLVRGESMTDENVARGMHYSFYQYLQDLATEAQTSITNRFKPIVDIEYDPFLQGGKK